MPLHELQLFWIDQALIIEYFKCPKDMVFFFFGKSRILAQEQAEIQSFIMSNYDYLGGIKYIKHSLINCCNLSICNLSFTYFSKPHILQFRYVSPLFCLVSCIHLNDQTFLCIFYFCNYFHARLLFGRIVTFLMLVGGVIQTVYAFVSVINWFTYFQCTCASNELLVFDILVREIVYKALFVKMLQRGLCKLISCLKWD